MTSGRRAVVAEWLRLGTDMPGVVAAAWADAVAFLVEAQWTEAAQDLLRYLVEDILTADAAYATLVGRPPVVPDELALRRRLRDELGVPVPTPPTLPAWAQYGTWRGPAGEAPAVFCRDELYLGDELDVDEWPPMSVMVYAEDDQTPAVLLEVSGSGTPELLPAPRARRVAAALVSAANIVDEVAHSG